MDLGYWEWTVGVRYKIVEVVVEKDGARYANWILSYNGLVIQPSLTTYSEAQWQVTPLGHILKCI